MTELYNQAISFFKPEQRKKEWYEGNLIPIWQMTEKRITFHFA